MRIHSGQCKTAVKQLQRYLIYMPVNVLLLGMRRMFSVGKSSSIATIRCGDSRIVKT